MAELRIGISGCAGRMGRMLVVEVAATKGCVLAGGVDAPQSPDLGKDIGELAGIGAVGLKAGSDIAALFAASDVVIEFALPEASVAHAALAAQLKKPLVIGTTGLDAKAHEALVAAAKSAPILWAPNMSLGVNWLLALVEQTAKRLGEEYDIEILEMHHRHKVDAPSGTALATARAIAAARRDAGRAAMADPTTRETLVHARGAEGPEGVRIHAVRLPGLVAHEEVLFGSPGEGLTLRHDSYDRQSFVAGVGIALEAVDATPRLVEGLGALLA